MKPGKRIEKLTTQDLGLCPCGRRIYADSKIGAVVHELPYCVQFRDLDPLEFLSYVRRSRGISDASVLIQ